MVPFDKVTANLNVTIMEEYDDMNQALAEMSCFQFALYGGTDADELSSVGRRFETIGNYLLDPRLADLDVLQHIDADYLNDNVAIHEDDENALHQAVMVALCAEFELEQEEEGPVELCGLLRHGQRAPEHMWFVINGYAYDTMPNQNLRRDDHQNARLHPPSEAYALNDGEVFSVNLSGLTAGQDVVVNGDWDYVP